jgi:hypothetical protein
MQTRSKKPRTRSAKKIESKSDDFVSVARRLEADEDKGRFEAKLKKIAKAKK